MRTLINLAAALCVTVTVCGQDTNNGTGLTDTDRIQKLEDAVRQLSSRNQELQQEINELRSPKLTHLLSSAETKEPALFVIPGGKEGKLVLGGYFQGNAEFGDVDAYRGSWSGTKGHDSRVFDRFRIRRARIGAWGDFWENFDFKVMGDFDQSDGTSPRTAFSATDVYLNWHRLPEANIKFGQFDTPFGMEQFSIPDMLTLTPERSEVTEGLRAERQIGVMVWGKPLADAWPEQKDVLAYYFGVFNGNLRNVTANDNNKFMYMARVEAQAFQGRLFGQPTTWKVGVDGYYSADATNTLVSQTGNIWTQPDGSLKPLYVQTRSDQRLAAGVDQRFNCGPLTIQAEYLQTHFHDVLATDRNFTAHGYWVLTGYQIIPNTLELVGKYEYFKPDRLPSDDLWTTTGGINWYVRGKGPGEITLMLDYLHTWSHFRELNPNFGTDQFDELMTRAEFSF
ncbi:MAG TPA: porin [Verrucomicrobiae bacterium]|nr:porin [Verrucomicrobiae bacterium]